MRRSDREVKDLSEILAIIAKSDVCRLGLVDGERAYIVPMNFGYCFECGVLTLYFHCADEGRKLDIIARNPVAGFEMDCSQKLITGDTAFDFSMEYESVIGSGRIELCHSITAKRDGLLRLMRHYAPEREFELPDDMLGAVTVFRLTAEEFSGKRHIVVE
jgi:nitroimidazol reductase NimA-like FMN-containing flavoprotein (pyridoxamine 5'-phosphate oxidase superfamily)